MDSATLTGEGPQSIDAMQGCLTVTGALKKDASDLQLGGQACIKLGTQTEAAGGAVKFFDAVTAPGDPPGPQGKVGCPNNCVEYDVPRPPGGPQPPPPPTPPPTYAPSAPPTNSPTPPPNASPTSPTMAGQPTPPPTKQPSAEPANNPTTPTKQEGGGGAGVAVAVVLALLLGVAFAYWFFVRRKRLQKRSVAPTALLIYHRNLFSLTAFLRAHTSTRHRH